MKKDQAVMVILHLVLVQPPK